MKNLLKTMGITVIVSVIVFSTVACNIDANIDVNPTPVAVNIAAIGGVTAPVTGATPVTVITETAQYSGTVSWSPAVSGTFAENTVYTATITLTAKSGYTFNGVATNLFTVAGATTVSNGAGSGVVNAVFPQTVSIVSTKVNIAAIQGVTPPAYTETPVSAIIETAV